MESNHSAGSSILDPTSGRGAIRTQLFQSAIRAQEHSFNPLIINVVYFIIKSSLCIYFMLKEESGDLHLNNFVQVSIGVDLATLLMLFRRLQNISEVEQIDLNIMNTLVKLIYISNQVYGNYFYYTCNDCEDTCPTLNTLAFVLLLLGYLNIALPCLLICLVFLCLHALIVILARTAPRQQHPATEEVINNLPHKTYKSGSGEGHSCPICTELFKDNEEIIGLPCGDQHLFHDECIKNWLRINAACPLCRTTIQ